ncbi:LOW QUALITY PROTEIN: SWI/SNF-related matrix-associated actin-dependent regulator of chromatin subfamily A containing DEAD/H box 1-like [Babylonia areolata]|uniref:LOW QUALITY PROTEIN: SWI/SNF-related matrix-associated actin-dependent regulator of chromatin subfamily A containing DEAD/H box 1-like n=1 Tax=Babylonia areolata TaxID=304850 RepID=UPI003FD5A921
MSQNGSIKLLQKFKFTKRTPGNTDENGRINGDSDPEKNTDEGAPRSVQSKSGSGSESDAAASPVYNKKFGSKGSLEGSSQESSPWLSKSHGIAKSVLTNGTSGSKSKSKTKSTKTKYRRVRTYSSSDSGSESDTSSVQTSQSSSQPSGTKHESKNGKWDRQLTDMFPSATPLQIRAAIVAAKRADSIEAGVDYLVKGHSKVKRKHEDTDGTKPRSFKRIRTMSEDSEDSHTSLPSQQSNSHPASDSQATESYTQSQSHPASDSQATESYTQSELQRLDSEPLTSSEETSVEFLRGAFPTLPKERLMQVLRDCSGSTDQAVIVLSSDVQDAEAGTQAEAERPAKVEACERRVQSSSARGTRFSNKGKKVQHENMTLSDDDNDYEEEGEDSDDSLDGDENSAKRDSVLSFLEEATLPELQLLPGCSRKKAEALIDLRPFRSWNKLMEKLGSCKQLSSSLVHGCHEIIGLRNAVVQLMKQCEQISGQMELVVSKLTGNLRGQKDEEDQITTQPALLNSELELKPYQLIGLNWLRIMHTQHLNGILADEMGLGKTVQAISFLAHLLEEGEEGPHVIVVPSSTIENWLRELSTWCPALGVIVYYGSQEERRATRHSIIYDGRDDFHVLLTTYNIATGSVEDRSLFKKFQFHYAVFDEGHMLKNMSSLRFQNLMKISAERRLLLTGTPLQNNLLELMSLLCFVMPDIFQGKTESLKKMFSMITRVESEQGKYEKERIAQAQRIMRPFVLRRLKKDVLTQLPKKTEEVRRCPLLQNQQELYASLVHKFSQEVEKSGSDQGGGMAMFMQLRKAANHPLLLRQHYNDEKLMKMARALAREPSHSERGALPELIMEDMAVMNDFDLIGLCKQYKKQIGKYELDPSWIRKSGKFHVLDSLLHTMKQQKDRVLIFSQFTMMLDIIEVYLKQKDISYLRLDGSTPVTDRQRLIDEFNEDPDIFIFLLSTRAGGLGINLTSANTIILHDIDFNPYNDKQAEDRCHRMGQKRPVKIIRLISENTVEEGMLRCAKAKLRLEQDVTTANEESDETQADVALLLREAISKAKNGAPSSPDTTTTTPAALSSACASSNSVS